MHKRISEKGNVYFESHKIYKYKELNFEHINFLIRNGFQLNCIDSGHVYLSNDAIAFMTHDKNFNSYFSIDIHIFYENKEIHCSKYLDINKERSYGRVIT